MGKYDKYAPKTEAQTKYQDIVNKYKAGEKTTLSSILRSVVGAGKKVVKTGTEGVQGLVTGGIRGVGNVAGAVFGGLDYITPGDQSGLPKTIKGITEDIASGFERVNKKDLNPESFASKSGKFVSDVGISTLATGGLGTVVGPAANVLGKYQKGAKLLATGATEAGVYGIADKGYTTPGEVTTGALLSGAIDKISKIPVVKKLTTSAKEGFRSLAESIALPGFKELSKRERGKVAGDVVETGRGLFKKTQVVRSPQEVLAIEEVSRLLSTGKLKKGMNETQKLAVLDDKIETLATTLKNRLRQSDMSISKVDMEQLFDDIAEKTLQNPSIVGDSEAALRKILPQLRQKLTKDKYYGDEILEIRKDFDTAVRAAKGEGVFDPKLENAFTTALRDFRQGLNGKVAELVPDAQVRKLLDQQSALYTAEKTIADRWATQMGEGKIGKALSYIQNLTGVPRTEIIELATALGLGTTVSPFLGTLLAGAAGVGLVNKGVQNLTGPMQRQKLAVIMQKFDDIIKNNPKNAAVIKAAKNAIMNMFNEKING